jgi:hypothetical protein
MSAVGLGQLFDLAAAEWKQYGCKNHEHGRRPFHHRRNVHLVLSVCVYGGVWAVMSLVFARKRGWTMSMDRLVSLVREDVEYQGLKFGNNGMNECLQWWTDGILDPREFCEDQFP